MALNAPLWLMCVCDGVHEQRRRKCVTLCTTEAECVSHNEIYFILLISARATTIIVPKAALTFYFA